MKRLKKITKVILWAPVVVVAIPPLLVFLILFGIPALIIGETSAAISLRIFRRREAGHVFLICTSRRNWHDFLKNNVIPVLPDNFRVIWRKSARGGEYPKILGYFARSHIFGISKPYLVAVTRRKLIAQSLNSVLQDLKANPKRSDESRQACAQIIRETEEELRTIASTVLGTRCAASKSGEA